MKVLWFSVTPSLFTPHGIMHNAGGWIASLQKIVMAEPSVKLGVAFHYNNCDFKYSKDGVDYYPIPTPRHGITSFLSKKKHSEEALQYYLKVIEEFNPDIIQIFGSENDFGRICKYTDKPVVIHIQGSMPPYCNALFPIEMNTFDFFFTKGLPLKRRLIGLRSKASFARRAEIEIDTIKSCKYFMGRTDWDNGLIELFNPQAEYFHVEEALRDSFLSTIKHWQWHDGKVSIVSVISSPWYKGVDLILKTAELLKRFTDLNFEWNIYGIRDIRFFENKYKIKATDVCVNIKGIASKDELVDALCNASCYVHPSYIDNSPNSVCEPQLLGVPVVATNVGGVSTILDNGNAGLLVPANAPYELANLIYKICRDKDLAMSMSEKERTLAKTRHDPEHILNQLLSTYNKILKA